MLGLLLLWKMTFGLKIKLNEWGNYKNLYHKTNKEAANVFCSVVKHLGSGRALKKQGKTLDFVSCFSLQHFHALLLPVCLITEQSTVEASLFVKCLFLADPADNMKDLLYQITTKEVMSTVKRMGYINNFTKVLLFLTVYHVHTLNTRFIVWFLNPIFVGFVVV